MYTMIIADDEEIERKSLGLLVAKEFPDIRVVGMAVNGAELVSLINRHQPDMAIVDINMPAISGIDAIELIKSTGAATRFIINTAYSHFDYAQKALQLKVDHYILKPQKRQETVATIRSLCQSIAQARQSRASHAQINQLFWNIQPVLESEILYSIFMGEPASASLYMWCEAHSVAFEGGVMVAAVAADATEGDFAGSRESLHGFIHAATQDMGNVLVSISNTGISMLVLVPAARQGSWRAWVRDVLFVLGAKLAKGPGLVLRMGVGGLCTDFAHMDDSYRQSLAALRQRDAGEVAFFQDGSGPSEDWLARTAQKAVQAAADGDAARADALLREALPLLTARQDLTRFWQLCQGQLLRQGLADTPENRALLQDALQDVLQQGQPAAQQQLLAARLGEALALLRGKADMASRHVQKALAIIDARYSEDLSLEAVAEALGISPFYLSHLVKAQLGKTFVACLTEARMRAAVQLVKTTRLPTKEIARRTGYQNQTYFCRVFKRQTGQTISAMRGEKGPPA